MTDARDHGGGIDAAARWYGGSRKDWLDLSTGINPVAYPVDELPPETWTALPDANATERLIRAARTFWKVPETLGILAAPGASALIARLPTCLGAPSTCQIEGPTYNEWGASFEAAGWSVSGNAPEAHISIAVHPNNPDGRLAQLSRKNHEIVIVDESFCDVCPEKSALSENHRSLNIDYKKFIILKSFGKFWGLAGLRLGFLIGTQSILDRLAVPLGPWPVSGPALEIGARALEDPGWAKSARMRLASDAERLDALMTAHGAKTPRGTTLFRLYEVENARTWQSRLARHRIWTRIFPYSDAWIRLGLPGTEADWARLEHALSDRS